MTSVVTTAADWKARSAGEIKVLPSGASIRIRRPSLFALSRSGHVPNPLAVEVIKWFAIDAPDSASPEDVTKQYRENAAAYVGVAQASVTEPRIVTDKAPDYDKGEIAPEDLSTADLIWIYQYVVSGIEIALGDSNDAGFQSEDIDSSGSTGAAV
jgi:hypothetical protein